MVKRATSYDVARLAGVSQATVSYVMSNSAKQTISEDTRKKVLAAAHELNYYSNNAAQALKRNRTGCVSVVIDKQIEHPRYGETLQALREALENNDYRVLLCKNQPGSNPALFIRDYFEKRVDGIVYIGADSDPVPAQTLAAVKKNHIPFVALDCSLTDPDIASVDIDYRYGMHAAMDKLISLGCQKIIYVCPESRTGQETARAAEFGKVCRQQNLAGEIFPLRMQHYLTYENTGLTYARWLNILRSQVFQEDWFMLKNKLRAEPDNTGIICSWRAMRDIVLVTLIKDKRSMPLVTLTYEPTLLVYTGRLFHTALPNSEAGAACAKSILQQIEEPSAISKVVIRTQDIEEEGPF